MATVELCEVVKSFGRIEAISGVSFAAAAGEFVVLVGPSGCGKSTLLRLIAGLEAPTAGEIRIDGRVVNRLAPKDRDIAMVFQSYALYPNLTAAENIARPLRLARRSRAEIRERVEKVARILSLTPYLDRYPRQLSGGQRQRVAMGRAIVREPKAFLFDEPLSNLDAQLRVQMRGEIRDLHRSLQRTTIYVTHDQVEAMSLADRIVVLRDGRVEQIGAPLDLYDRPDNTFVAGFLGAPPMNLVAGVFAGPRDFRVSGGPAIPLPLPAGVGTGRPVVLGLRAEHLALTAPEAAPVSASVAGIETSGADSLVMLRAPGLALTALLRARAALRPGDRVGLGFAPEHLLLFDGATGRRLIP